jgi:DHA2 family multidrug resistance protein
MRLSVLKQGDWAGIGSMAIGLAALQTALEEGNRHDWFGSSLITWLTVIAVIALALFPIIELRAKTPLVNLRLLKVHNFGVGAGAMTLFGLLLYGSVFVLPLYLSQTQGYNAMQIGEVLAWTGLPQLVLIPIMPWLMKRVDLKYLIAGGLVLFAVSNFMNIHLTRDVGAPELLLPNIVRAIGQAMIMTPLTAVATGGIAPKDAASSSAIFNMLRNLGGALGIALMQTYLTKREQFHSNILTHAVSVFDTSTIARIERLQDYFMAHGVADADGAWHRAVVAVGRVIRGQANIMAYSDAFMLFGGVALLTALVALFLRPIRGTGDAAAH